MDNKQLDFLDILSIISFAIQLQNQGNIIQISDIQEEVDRAIDLINQHLENQDQFLNNINKHLANQDNILQKIQEDLRHENY